MTAEWATLGLWEAYKKDLEERDANMPYVARPSTLGLEHYYDTYVGRKAKEYLETYDRKQPWFCWVSFGGPHEPWDAPEPYASAYAPDAMPKALTGNMTGGANRPRGRLDKRLQSRLPLTPQDVAALRANYAGNVSLIDDLIGSIFKVIEARGEMSNTIVALVSDHGEMNGDFGLLYKGNFLESAVRIPFLIRTPETAAGSGGTTRRICASPIEWFDLGPTLVDLAEGEIAYPQFAKSLLPCLKDTKTQMRQESLCELSGEIMIRGTRWKMAVNREGKAYLLFDLENDPTESRNLAGLGDYRDVEAAQLLRMRERILEAQMKSGFRADSPVER